MVGVLPRFHGLVRGLEGVASSPQFEGRFGRIFRTLPPARVSRDGEELKKLAAAMTAALENPPTPEDQDDDEENSGISAGYTYLGQFIDHDLTFDPNSSLDKQNDPNALVDYRTPRFDLDSVYGRGPDDQPYLYEDGGLRMLLGRPLTGNPHDPKTRDLPRNVPGSGPKRALIGDPRNDENVIVSQLQGIFLRFHNRMVEVLQGTDATFEDVQRYVRWHYQWVVLHDFLPTILGQETLEKILPHLKKKSSIYEDKPNLQFYHFDNDPFIPVEFSVAAYRFGHSMVRPIYRLNSTLPDRFAIFSMDPNTSLTGFREFPSPWAIDWTLFFDFGNHPPKHGPGRVQPAYKIDSSLVNPLAHLPASIGGKMVSLPERNLLRGWRMSLPSGQDVARKMGIKPISDDDLRVGKATEADSANNTRLVDIAPIFKDNAPLWYYILAEAQQHFKKNDTPIHLGRVGGRIVGEVFVGLLLGDKHSFLNQDPNWKPLEVFTPGGKKFGIADLISEAMKA
jgi:hypothetical protein